MYWLENWARTIARAGDVRCRASLGGEAAAREPACPQTDEQSSPLLEGELYLIAWLPWLAPTLGYVLDGVGLNSDDKHKRQVPHMSAACPAQLLNWTRCDAFGGRVELRAKLTDRKPQWRARGRTADSGRSTRSSLFGLESQIRLITHVEPGL